MMGEPGLLLTLFWFFLVAACFAMSMVWFYSWRLTHTGMAMAFMWAMFWLGLGFLANLLVRSFGVAPRMLVVLQRVAFVVALGMFWVGLDQYVAMFSDRLPRLEASRQRVFGHIYNGWRSVCVGILRPFQKTQL